MSARLEVLIVVNSLGFGGAERMVERLVLAATASERVRYTVCSLEDEGPIGAALRARGVEVVALRQRRSGAAPIARAALRVRRLLRRRRFDLVHSFLYRSHCVARLARLGLGPWRAPLISSEHCLGDNRPRAALLVNRTMSFLSDRIQAVAEAVRDTLVARDHVPARKIVVVRNGIEAQAPDAAARRRLRRALGMGDEVILFLQLGRLHREKGADVFLQALGILASSGIGGWRAALVGEGPEREALNRMARALGVRDRVLMPGARPRVGPWIDAADVVVLPSREEGLPVAPLEAMAKGKPIVAARVGGTPEVVEHQKTGLLVPPEDPASLAAALGALAWDPRMREDMGRRGYLRVRSEFSVERMTAEMLDLYEDVLRRPAERHAARRAPARAGRD